LYNRRYLEERLETELQRGIHYRHPIGIIMLDIDHFKQFNDTYGHKAGDVMLQEVGKFLSATIRGEDVVCRYGGEEFTIILPTASLEHTRKRAEQLAQGERRLQIAYDGNLLGTVTLSFGVACFPKHGVTSESLIRAADVALYHAKDRGRDQVVVADSVLGLSELLMHC
jgi:diguanylate cyclase (GGDEF)-like protein